MAQWPEWRNWHCTTLLHLLDSLRRLVSNFADRPSNQVGCFHTRDWDHGFREEYHRDDAPFCSRHTRGYVVLGSFTDDVNPGQLGLGFSTAKLLLSPFCLWEPESLKCSPHSWARGEVSCTSGRVKPQRICEHTYIHVKTTRLINKYLGGDTRKLRNYSIFSINFCSFISAFIGGSRLQRLLLWCSSGNFLFLSLLTEVLLCRRAFPFPLFIRSFI